MNPDYRYERMTDQKIESYAAKTGKAARDNVLGLEDRNSTMLDARAGPDLHMNFDDGMSATGPLPYKANSGVAEELRDVYEISCSVYTGVR